MFYYYLFQYEGTPFYPNNDRFWLVVKKYKVNQFYTAPTAIRALMKFEDELVKRYETMHKFCCVVNKKN